MQRSGKEIRTVLFWPMKASKGSREELSARLAVEVVCVIVKNLRVGPRGTLFSRNDQKRADEEIDKDYFKTIAANLFQNLFQCSCHIIRG
mmetsp:Transcript_25162/g.37611  ORF Transcript_25162/g.37611 Transcript_25162/m.37611 type:complete len:90 (-) Transcript_25162:60-329(-)